MPQLIDATRIQLICPAGNKLLKQAAIQIVKLLKRQEFVQKWHGFTYSSLRQLAFIGKFWDVPEVKRVHEGRWTQPDQNIVIFIDAPERTLIGLINDLSNLRAEVARIYAQHPETDQKSLWITTQPLRILYPDDPAP